MANGITDLIESERGILTILLVVAVTLLAIAKIVTGEQWLAYTQAVAIALVASKTVTGAIETWKSSKAPSA